MEKLRIRDWSVTGFGGVLIGRQVSAKGCTRKRFGLRRMALGGSSAGEMKSSLDIW
ncbi:hypothetical protein GCM10007854_19730 [Algimonas porphyrae]|uniref:Uncharacterized protein n=1 Tax=Algimonas porphyrae TaxID=1128113 RepID=A0ABQ5V0D8_9PROT|nr:hypothetical protein GCM10007854_19730 [Algimonas porphyrae]